MRKIRNHHRPVAPNRLSGVLGRLRRDTRGNVLMLMAAMLIPLAAFSGAAIDMARLYAVKSRLQQACDAGALAGAKNMIGNVIDTSSTGPAQTFFASNFQLGWFATSAQKNANGTTQATFTPSVTSQNHVQGSASVTVPMTLMKMFGIGSRTVAVTCEAQFDGDVDIMFVLDTTGSMACSPGDSQSTCDNWDGNNVRSDSMGYYVNEKSDSRISAVRSSVLSFFDTVTSKTDTTNTSFRFGFVPFSGLVNVGVPSSQTPNSVGSFLLGRNYLATSWTYQSRCNAPSKSACTQASNSTTYVYNPYSLDTSQYILGKAVDNPAQKGTQSVDWDGCVEEPTGKNAAGQPIDLDVDAAATWAPVWPDVEFYRASDGESTSSSRSNTYRPGSDVAALLYEEFGCPTAVAQRLSKYQLPGDANSSAKSTVKQAIQNYMLGANGYRAWGSTYLDEGMTWGTRLLSPNGIFASDTAPWPGHAGVNRYLILLTDGTMETDCYAYSSHGMEAYDHRVISSACTAVGPNPDPTTALNVAHYSRLSAACTAAKNHNITVFVILFGQSVASANQAQAAPPQFTACATSGQAYYAKDKDNLDKAFNAIAGQVALLRLSK